MDERYISVKQSLIDSCKEVNDIENGLKEGYSWEDLVAMVDNITP